LGTATANSMTYSKSSMGNDRDTDMPAVGKEGEHVLFGVERLDVDVESQARAVISSLCRPLPGAVRVRMRHGMKSKMHPDFPFPPWPYPYLSKVCAYLSSPSPHRTAQSYVAESTRGQSRGWLRSRQCARRDGTDHARY
jgi:hypothetical protein